MNYPESRGEVVMGQHPYFTIGDPQQLGAFIASDRQVDSRITIIALGETAELQEGQVATFAGLHGHVIHPEDATYVPYPKSPTTEQQRLQIIAEGRMLKDDVIKGMATSTGYFY